MRSKRIHLLGFVALAAAYMGAGQASQAQSTDDASIFKDADLTLGRRLIEEHRCAQCHARKFGGDGRAVYRPMERLKTAGNLRHGRAMQYRAQSGPVSRGSQCRGGRPQSGPLQVQVSPL